MQTVKKMAMTWSSCESSRKSSLSPSSPPAARGKKEDFLKAFEAGADAALAASVFHFGEIAIPDLKHYLAKNGVEIRV